VRERPRQVIIAAFDFPDLPVRLFPKTLTALLFSSLTAVATPAGADATYVIIRHGEKPPGGLGQLTCQGLNRALALPPVLLARFGVPAELFAPNPAVKKADKGVPYFYIRPLATIEPLAIRLGMPVDISWEMTQVKPLAEALLQKPDGTYVIVWEHHLAVQLAQALLLQAGGDPAQVPHWQDNDFDSIYVVRRPAGAATAATFRIERQGLNKLPEACPDNNAKPE